ncbi:hypothetical protein K470DRAFT_259875 [Piedraia hortae CBS 480.64]|uniref:Uncharacterized protein n=1 Tax=Piedraia hortae CBS 480.64 TaxID=1314780 RepID=A0A6A7BSZ6_9PEZI|nr:hypothetical protein K470DRAFT_259875 [Piedraia hortae CBS 480.64]
MPLSIKYWPKEWSRTDDFPMYKFIAPLFVDPTELLSIEQAIGNALIDPVASSKAVILYGEGGTGKSTLLAAIKTSFMGCCGSIPGKSLVGLSKGSSKNQTSELPVTETISKKNQPYQWKWKSLQSIMSLNRQRFDGSAS